MKDNLIKSKRLDIEQFEKEIKNIDEIIIKFKKKIDVEGYSEGMVKAIELYMDFKAKLEGLKTLVELELNSFNN